MTILDIKKEPDDTVDEDLKLESESEAESDTETDSDGNLRDRSERASTERA